MIRIDELYDNTFWPWMQEHRPGTRMFYCDPPGYTGVDNLFNHGYDDLLENDYIFMHDQEPVDLELYEELFNEVVNRNKDRYIIHGYHNPKQSILRNQKLPEHIGSVIVSEKGEYVQQLCNKYSWVSYYYFWHGWAALDWYRGYDKTFLIKRATDRNPTKTFMSPNRIIGGKRDHRVLFLYEVFKRKLQNNHISAPRTCPVECTDITHIASKYQAQIPDITNVLATKELPITFANEDTQKMSSCWLDNFEAAQDSMFYVPTETVFFGSRLHITEKTFKAIALEMPFILVAPAHSLQYLRSYGFQTFGTIVDESYDEEEDDLLRIQKVGQLLEDINNLSLSEKQHIWKHCSRIDTHNYTHFYNGNFEKILWKEFILMLSNIEKDYHAQILRRQHFESSDWSIETVSELSNT
jgi:hypothetical protein